MTLWQLGLVSGGSTQTFSGAEKFWFPVRKKNSSAAQQPIRLSFSSCCSRKLPMTIGCEAIKLASISASQGNLSATAKRCKMPWPPPDSAPALLLSSRPTYFRFHFTTRSLLDGRCFKQIGQTYQTFCQTKTSGAQWKHGNIMSLLGKSHCHFVLKQNCPNWAPQQLCFTTAVQIQNTCGPEQQHYCWWTKSCTTKDDDYPIIYGVLIIPGGAGFRPPTVSLSNSEQWLSCTEQLPCCQKAGGHWHDDVLQRIQAQPPSTHLEGGERHQQNVMPFFLMSTLW